MSMNKADVIVATYSQRTSRSDEEQMDEEE